MANERKQNKGTPRAMRAASTIMTWTMKCHDARQQSTRLGDNQQGIQKPRAMTKGEIAIQQRQHAQATRKAKRQDNKKRQKAKRVTTAITQAMGIESKGDKMHENQRQQ
jgi:hypothetical protein